MENTAPKDPNVSTDKITPAAAVPNPVSQTPPNPPEAAPVPTAAGIPPPTPAPLQAETINDTLSPKKSSKLLVFVLCVLVATVIIIGAVYFMMLQNENKAAKNAQNQAVSKSPTPAPPTATPTPDNSNTGLEQQNQAVIEDLNGLDTQVNKVNSAFSDQQTNLQ